jgi:hypothetical protein
VFSSSVPRQASGSPGDHPVEQWRAHRAPSWRQLWRWIPAGAAHRPLSQRSHFAGGLALAAGRASAMSGEKAPATAARRRRALRSSGLSSSSKRSHRPTAAGPPRHPTLGPARLWTPALTPGPLPTDYGTADDIKPLATHAEGEGRWNRCCPVEADPAPPSPWRCQRVREIERPLRRLRYDNGPHDGLFGRRTHAATYERKASVTAKAVEPLRTTYATRAERTRASPLCCHARAVSVGVRPWVMDVR